ncbi:hypothetical protein BPAE_0167g00130 [Botrytis paeoniae]|uniref:Glycine zipper 2TM domain-containing protein n=1 Tax=Botrytis paeoniae TaxID=278948 RepID=A0A4Z1FGS7_9HELO|nr:hypothetical protein BPAE_0167g00130 [Botrytis paeoniae]
MSNQDFYGGGNQNPYPPHQPYGAAPPQPYPQQPQYGQDNTAYPPAPNYSQNPYPPQNLQPPYGAPGPSPAHSPGPYGAPPQQSPYGQNPYPPPNDPYGNQQLNAYTDNRGYSPAPTPYGAPAPYGSAPPGGAPTYHEPGANLPPQQLDANGQPIEGDRGLVSMGLGAAGGWGVASQTGRGTMGKLLYAAGGMIAGQFLGNKVKKYRKDHNNRDVEYYEDAQTGRECSPPRDGEGSHSQHGGYRDEKYSGHGGYEEDRHSRHHEHGHQGHHGHEHRSHSRHSSHSHGRRHDDDRY